VAADASVYLTDICETIIYKMREPRRLTALWASTACYREQLYALLENEGASTTFYRESLIFLSENEGASTSHNPTSLHGILQGEPYIFIIK
jgi:hypothetical protein